MLDLLLCTQSIETIIGKLPLLDVLSDGCMKAVNHQFFSGGALSTICNTYSKN
jgi:hypothetical protein